MCVFNKQPPLTTFQGAQRNAKVAPKKGAKKGAKNGGLKRIIRPAPKGSKVDRVSTYYNLKKKIILRISKPLLHNSPEHFKFKFPYFQTSIPISISISLIIFFSFEFTIA